MCILYAYSQSPSSSRRIMHLMISYATRLIIIMYNAGIYMTHIIRVLLLLLLLYSYRIDQRVILLRLVESCSRPSHRHRRRSGSLLLLHIILLSGPRTGSVEKSLNSPAYQYYLFGLIIIYANMIYVHGIWIG